MIIFARDFDNEIITTLSVNRARGTLNVIPVKVTFDENNANSLKDLSVVTGGFVVSALTGDLISTQKFEELPVVDRVSLDSGKLIIYNEKVTSDISVLIGELQQRRKDTGHEAMQALLDKRLRSLTSLSVRIKCEHTMASLIPEIDLLLRTSRAIVRNGVVNLHEWRVPDVFASSHQEAINVSKIPETTPVLTALATIKQGTQAAAELLSINAALTVD
jgi:chaperonin GroEL